jgi:hypothetical protein
LRGGLSKGGVVLRATLAHRIGETQEKKERKRNRKKKKRRCEVACSVSAVQFPSDIEGGSSSEFQVDTSLLERRRKKKKKKLHKKKSIASSKKQKCARDSSSKIQQSDLHDTFCKRKDSAISFCL